MSWVLLHPRTIGAQTVTYKISVTIPAIIGFNMPPYDDPLTLHHTPRVADQHHFDMIEEEVEHFGELVLLRTIVVK